MANNIRSDWDSACGLISPTLDATTGQPPAQPEKPVVCLTSEADCEAPAASRMRLRNGGTANDDAAKVRVEWQTEKNADGGHVDEGITAFKVEILDSDGNFQVHTGCDVNGAGYTLPSEFVDGTVNPHCFIDMKSFWSGEFKMDQGTYITVRVTAKNIKGESLPSQWNIDGAVV